MAYYVQLDSDYWQHPKTLALIAILGPFADIYPIRLWSWCARYKRDGILADQAQIALACGLDGGLKRSKQTMINRRSELVLALIKAGFLESDGLTIHGWIDRTGGDIAIYEAKKRKMRESYHKSNGNLPAENQQPSTNLPSIGTERIGTDGTDRIGTAQSPPPPMATGGDARPRGRGVVKVGMALPRPAYDISKADAPQDTRQIVIWLQKCQYPSKVLAFIDQLQPSRAKEIISEIDAQKANADTPMRFITMLREKFNGVQT